jgi:hypothetical protein
MYKTEITHRYHSHDSEDNNKRKNNNNVAQLNR